MQYEGKGFSIAALVLGIVSVVLAWFYMVNIAALVCGVVGIILAIKGKKAAAAANAPTGMATAGLVLSIIGLVIGFIGFFACTVCVCTAAGVANQIANEEGWQEIIDALTTTLPAA